MNGKERILSHLAGRPVDALPFMPITMMFAADCIGVPYGEYARDHRVLAEAQLRTAEQFDIDHVSAISDPTREAADHGAAVIYYEDRPPAIDEEHALLADKSILLRLTEPDPGSSARMCDRLYGLRLLSESAGEDRLVEGWVEGPCAEAADLRGINRLMVDFFDDPPFVQDLMQLNVAVALRFAAAQVQAGADIIGVGDAAASLVGPRIYDRLVWPYQKALVSGLKGMGGPVRLHICGDTRAILAGIGRLGCDIVDLDYPTPMSVGRERMGPAQMLLGNIDPVRVVRDGSPETIVAAIRECHVQAGSRYIVGAGCEIPRDTPPANVYALARYARSHQPEIVSFGNGEHAS
jgi:MtaA/CmuA family methyltransferase